MEVVVVVVYAARHVRHPVPRTAAAVPGAAGSSRSATVPLALVVARSASSPLAVQPVPATDAVTVRRFLVGLLSAPFLLGLAAVHEVQTLNEAQYEWVADNVDGLAVTTALELPRMMWFQDTEWLNVDDYSNPGDMTRVLTSLAEDGPETVSLVLLDADMPRADRVVEGQDTLARGPPCGPRDLTVVVLER